MTQRKEIERVAGRRYLRKAEEFLRSATDSLARSDWDAAAGSAIHAGISAADAYLAWIHGVRNTSKDHIQAVALLKDLGGAPVAEKAAALRRLIKRKSAVEYDDRLLTEREAREALARAERLVAWARDSVRK